jgi:hypothetical protein
MDQHAPRLFSHLPPIDVMYAHATTFGAPLRRHTRPSQFLIDVGLPDQAAPFLIFSALRALRSAVVVYGLDKSAGEQVIIGSTGLLPSRNKAAKRHQSQSRQF